MTTPRIEEMVSRKVAITNYLRNTYGLDDGDTLNAGEVAELCEMIVEHFATQAHQAGIDKVVEAVEKLIEEKFYSFGVFNDLDPQTKVEEILQALQDNK